MDNDKVVGKIDWSPDYKSNIPTTETNFVEEYPPWKRKYQLDINVQLNCIVCGKELHALKTSNKMIIGSEIGTGMFDDCIVDKISANYGSIYDSDVFAIGICDDCVVKAQDEKKLVYLYNYMGIEDNGT